MRGTTNEADFDKFVEAVSGFPPARRGNKSAQEVFQHSYGLLKDLVARDPEFTRAAAWQGYALALSVSEGWPLTNFPEENSLSPDARLDKAFRLANDAKNRDPTDYDLWWALGNIELVRRDFDAARAAFDRALYLNRDEQNPNLFADVADAMVHLGDHAAAERFIQKALRKPDWYHWVSAWAFFMKANRYPDNASLFLNLALDQIKKTRTQPGDPGYLVEMQLLLSAIHTRKQMLSGGEPADHQEAAAREAVARFSQAFDYWDDAQTRRFAPFKDGTDVDYWAQSISRVWSIKG
jgi:tetratricopeptide (TPR) repeat protein